MEKFLWHSLDSEKVIEILRSNKDEGLSQNEVQARQKMFGKNRLPEEKPLSSSFLLLSQFKNPLIYILLIAAIITFILHEITDCYVILGAVFLNVIVGFLQERKAQKTLITLKKTIKNKAKVLRDGGIKIIDAQELVLGDIIILTAGDKVPSDGRLIEAHQLEINQMALTGEWLPARKITHSLPQDTPLADRDNMIFMGTIVESGFGKAIVTGIGLETEIGKIAKILKETKEEPTPYQRKLAHFSRTIGKIILFLSLFIFFEGMISLKELPLIERFKEMFTTTVAIAVAAIPEGLPVSMTVILALGMQRILQKKGLVRRMASAETLGATSVIATDKTGTLTQGQMVVEKIIGKKEEVLKCLLLTSEAFVENPNDSEEKWIIQGKPTEKALFKISLKYYGYPFLKEWEKKKVDQLLFDSKRKFKAVLYQKEDTSFLFVCGAPEKILEKSLILDSEKDEWEKEFRKLASLGLRVIACAKKEFSKKKEKIEDIKNLDFLGLVILKDPIRKDAKEALKKCQEAGMKVIIVSGDHKLTAKAIAQEVGLRIKEDEILEGKDLDKYQEKELLKILPKIKIYARVEPRHKLRVIQAWQKIGKIIAMTGDGINDAPALKKADIGVALGSGSDVAKEVSDLVLLDDSFSTIVLAVEEGRRIVDNIQKVITYLLSDSFCEIILIGGSILFGLPLPVLASQILWVNLIEDSFPAISLAFEPKEKDIMKRKPTPPNTPLLTPQMKTMIFLIGILTSLLLLIGFFWLLKSNLEISKIRTIIFASLAVNSLIYVFSCKNLRKNIWHENIFSNKILIGSVILGFSLILLAVYFPPLQYLLKTRPLNFYHWIIVFGLSSINIILMEICKLFFIIKRKK